MNRQLQGFIQLMRLDKPVGIYLLLWPTLWALLFAAGGIPDIKILMVFVLGVVLTRSAGCVINDYADRHLDGAVKRTANRPLVTKQVTPRQALGLFMGLMLCAFLLVIQLNYLTVLMSVVALFLAALYPFMKRYTHLPQVFLGAAFGFAIPMAYAAVQMTVPLTAWILYAANICWIVAYDTAYAMVDRDDDLQVGIKSTAILFGQFDRLAIAVLQLIFLLLLSVFAQLQALNPVFYLSLLAAAVSFIFQHYLLRTRDRDMSFRAFKNNNITGILITTGVVAHCALV